jgi:hypothetical protein
MIGPSMPERVENIMALGVGSVRVELGSAWVRVSAQEYEIRGPHGPLGWCPRSREAIQEVLGWETAH